MDKVLENVSIDAWAKALSRAPGQANAPHESDSELVVLPGDPGNLLAITIDTVAEEIRAGLYREPYTMGWVTVMASLSDLAAVGADALGVVVSVSIPPAMDAVFQGEIARGMEEACRSLGVFVLGGDTNEAPDISLTGCAVGIVPRDDALTRRGIEPGDAVFITGRAGSGNALGLARLAGLPDDVFPESSYRPSARLSAGQALRGRAGAVMDTSDGVLTTLDQLMRLNGHGFEIDCDWTTILSEDVVAMCDQTETPYWMMLAGPHGEFELAFTVPSSSGEVLDEEADSMGLTPLRIGTVLERPEIVLVLPPGQRVEIEMSALRNLLVTRGDDLVRYVAEFREMGRSWGLE